MAERRAVVSLGEPEIQAVEQVVLDDDREAALDFVKTIVRPQIDAQLNRGHCRPVFEWGKAGPPVTGPSGPPHT